MSSKRIDRGTRAALASSATLVGLILLLLGYEVFVRDADAAWDAPARGAVFVPLLLPIAIGIWCIGLFLLESILKRVNLLKAKFVGFLVAGIAVLFGISLTVGIQGEWWYVGYQFILTVCEIVLLLGLPLAVWWRVLKNEP